MTETRTVLVISDAFAGGFTSEILIVNLTFAQLNANAISKILPDLIILPLFGPGFDAIDALARIERSGFRGEVIVRSPDLPNSRLVERELASVAPNLRVRLTGTASGLG